MGAKGVVGRGVGKGSSPLHPFRGSAGTSLWTVLKSNIKEVWCKRFLERDHAKIMLSRIKRIYSQKDLLLLLLLLLLFFYTLGIKDPEGFWKKNIKKRKL